MKARISLFSIFVILVLLAGPLLRAGTPQDKGKPPGEPKTPAAEQKGKSTTWKGSGKNGAIAAGSKEAVDAGLAVLKGGGNAADAAAASILVLTVTESNIVCFGGEVPIVVYDAKRGSVEVISGMGTAPRLATREHFAKKGGIPGKGVEPAPVPATLDACLTLLERHGTRTFAEAVAPALALLDQNKQNWHADLARTIRRLIEAEQAAPRDRIRGLRLVADCFYRGPIARELDAWSRANGGLLRYTDLATYVTRIEEPAAATYRGYTVYKCGAWNQGPCLLQALRILEGFDLKAMGHNKADSVHVMIEAMKLAFADRDAHYGDPLFTDVPLEELLSVKYAELRRPLIDLKTASNLWRPGDPRGGKALLDDAKLRFDTGAPDLDTTTCVTADRDGNLVASTPSGFAGVIAGKTGIRLSSRLQSFNIWEGHPNCIEPGKRPRITLTPGLVLKDGKPALAVSVAGGDAQDQTALQLLVNYIDFGLRPEESVTAPRFGTNHFVGSFRQKAPVLGSLLLGPGFDEAIVKELKDRGHKVTMQKTGGLGAPVLLAIDPETRVIEAAGDPRTRRNAGAY
jgi:gamma-glutamyltranspeptidase/glutathione hydrolase